MLRLENQHEPPLESPISCQFGLFGLIASRCERIAAPMYPTPAHSTMHNDATIACYK